MRHRDFYILEVEFLNNHFRGISLKFIGGNVKRLRKTHNLNQIEFAKLIGSPTPHM
ncbi:hypothetical protein GCM10008018_60830 [Paenibacillus marchantiophytorum]|uniref:XRE family transcriptional regulator n=1 Tax=Paenibacillus marchantiophytorum TaxID=1619310 RepID=A0ABQ1FCF7_9BACL|nr:hypothetical protein GCM10008018_60830 [Paenibacillus marchantiophytorum]